MKSIAEALVFAVVYINQRDDEYGSDEDVHALESIAGLLSQCAPEEKAALKKAAERLHKELKDSKTDRKDVLSDYENWMMNMFPADEN